jgi:hypothetical protein
MRNGRGGRYPRPISLAGAAAKRELIALYRAQQAGSLPGGHETPPRAIPVPRAGEGQPRRLGGARGTVRKQRTDGEVGDG